MNIDVVQSPPLDRRNDHYVSNRAPLSPDPLAKLPLGSVHASGWLRHQLDLMVNGQHGRLEELSSFLEADNGWFGTKKEGWEEQPYWLRGFYPLAVAGLIACHPWRTPPLPSLRNLSSMTLGIYLFHYPFIAFAQPFVASWDPLARTPLLTALGLGGSLMLGGLARRCLGAAGARRWLGF